MHGFREYVYLDGLPVAVLEPDGRVLYIHADHLGTPRAVTSDKGTLRWEWQFQSNPFGELPPNETPTSGQPPFVLNLRFPGQYYDAESGLHYNYFRGYEPETGRYVQSDPIGLAGGPNTFSYVENSPINAIDPRGLVKLYGSWCGPNWTGGFRKSYDEMDDIERSVALPPIDSLDECCQDHDMRYADCRSEYPCDSEARRKCFQNADRELSSCSGDAGGGQSPQILLFGNPQKRINDYMNSSNPSPGPDADHCGCD